MSTPRFGKGHLSGLLENERRRVDREKIVGGAILLAGIAFMIAAAVVRSCF